MITFNVIQIKNTEFDGRLYYDTYEYVTGIGVNDNGMIIINTSSDVLKGMRFNDWNVQNDKEKKLREQFIELVKNYFSKKNHEVSYKVVTVKI